MNNSAQITGSIVRTKVLKDKDPKIVSATVAGSFQESGDRERTFFTDVKAFGGVAERLDQCQVGQIVVLGGRMQQDSYEKDGERRSSTDVIVTNVMTPKNGGETRETQGGTKILLGAENVIRLEGNLTKEPTAIGDKGAYATIAVDRVYQTRSGEERKATSFLLIKAWDGAAKELLRMSKGTKIGVKGYVSTASFEDKNGEKQFRTEVTARFVSEIAFPKRDQEAASDSDETASNPPAESNDQEGQLEDLPF